MNEITPSEDEIEVLRDKDDYQRVEFWTDGDWVFLGKDVLDDKCIEVRFEEFRDLIDTLRATTGVDKISVEASYGGTHKYIVDCGYSLEVYRNREVVLYWNDHEYGVLYTAHQKTAEKRRTFDDVRRVYSYVKYIQPPFCKLEEITDRNHQVTLVDEDQSFVKVNFIEDLLDDDAVSGLSIRTKDNIEYTFNMDVEEIDER